MGIYNNIHDVNDDDYYYCPRNDCACHSPDYYDSSRNYDFFRTPNNIADISADHDSSARNVNIYDSSHDGPNNRSHAGNCCACPFDDHDRSGNDNNFDNKYNGIRNDDQYNGEASVRNNHDSFSNDNIGSAYRDDDYNPTGSRSFTGYLN